MNSKHQGREGERATLSIVVRWSRDTVYMWRSFDAIFSLFNCFLFVFLPKLTLFCSFSYPPYLSYLWISDNNK